MTLLYRKSVAGCDRGTGVKFKKLDYQAVPWIEDNPENAPIVNSVKKELNPRAAHQISADGKEATAMQKRTVRAAETPPARRE